MEQTGACSDSSAHTSLLREENEVLSTLGKYDVLCACLKERVVMGFHGYPYEGKWETELIAKYTFFEKPLLK